MRIHGRHYATGATIEVLCDDGLISAVTSPSTSPPDLKADWIAPALFDLQINGCDGISFNSEHLNDTDVRHVVTVCQRHGIGSFCPTVITNSADALLHAFASLRQACDTDRDLEIAIPVFHLEGPYISAEEGPRGAHPRQHIRPPDWDEFCRFQEAAGGRIRLVTLAPEQDGALRFVERLVRSGVVVALGHTAANGVCIREAIAAGARLSTHLGNGCHALLPRHENYIWEQLAADALWASIICDGHHLPPAVVRCILRVKTPARSILISDASSLAGLPVGHYRAWDQDLEVLSEGKIIVANSGFLAGSWAFTDCCVGNAIRFGGVKLADAVDMAGARPRELLGLPPRRLERQQPADLVLFDWQESGDFEVVATILRGRIVSLADTKAAEDPVQ
jgi:N-acetylglucosamine-6-phosphate deacetylase